MHHYFLFGVIAVFDSQLRWTRWLLSFIVHDSTYPRLTTSISDFLQIFTKILQESQKYVYLLCISKEESRTVNYCTRQYKGHRGLKGPRRSTEPSDLLYFEKAARLRQKCRFSAFSEADHPSKDTTSFCLDSSIERNQLCTLTSDQIEALLPVSKAWFPIVARERTEGTPKNSVKPWARPPRNPPGSYEL